jgi:hypothetical protein
MAKILYSSVKIYLEAIQVCSEKISRISLLQAIYKMQLVFIKRYYTIGW